MNLKLSQQLESGGYEGEVKEQIQGKPTVYINHLMTNILSNKLEFLPVTAAGGTAGRSGTAGTAWGVASTMASTRDRMGNTRDTILQCEMPGARLYIL